VPSCSRKIQVLAILSEVMYIMKVLIIARAIFCLVSIPVLACTLRSCVGCTEMEAEYETAAGNEEPKLLHDLISTTTHIILLHKLRSD
jgi:hypothetical protein